MTSPNFNYLNMLRAAELEAALPMMKGGARLLEIGAGTGRQALELHHRGFDVSAIELESSNYSAGRIFPIIDYDGVTFPFPDATFDVVFSSNTLEHVRDLGRLHAEVHRVLKPDGQCIHILPTHGWRFWTSVLAFPGAVRQFVTAKSLGDLNRGFRRLGRATFQNRHGERGNAWSEIYLFHPKWWRANFLANGFKILNDKPVGLFYSGEGLLGPKWNLEARRRAAATLGSACHLFQLQSDTKPEA